MLWRVCITDITNHRPWFMLRRQFRVIWASMSSCLKLSCSLECQLHFIIPSCMLKRVDKPPHLRFADIITILAVCMQSSGVDKVGGLDPFEYSLPSFTVVATTVLFAVDSSSLFARHMPGISGNIKTTVSAALLRKAVRPASRSRL